MKMNCVLFLFFTFLTGVSLAEIIPNITFDFRTLSSQMVSEVGDDISKKYSIRICGITSAVMDCVETIGLDFTINHCLTKDEARELIVDCAEEFMNKFNNNQKIKPFLQEYKLQPKNLKISIYIHDSKGNQLYHPNIGIVSTYCGSVFYKTHDSQNEYGYKSVISESFDEAVKIVQQSKCN